VHQTTAPVSTGTAGQASSGARRYAPATHRVSRRGAALIIVIVCVAVASVILASLTRLAMTQHQAARTEHWELQAGWLLESGLDRAAARLAADGNYTGETWRVPAEVFGGEYAAVVKIRVTRPPNAAGGHQVHVVADFPDHPRNRARRSKQLITDN
jgi:hypothetical protein